MIGLSDADPAELEKHRTLYQKWHGFHRQTPFIHSFRSSSSVVLRTVRLENDVRAPSVSEHFLECPKRNKKWFLPI